jgi:hypothetical protein
VHDTTFELTIVSVLKGEKPGDLPHPAANQIPTRHQPKNSQRAGSKCFCSTFCYRP